MTTLIELKGTDGDLFGTCDARCYNAKGVKCVCVCGGLNHGEGLDQATQNTKDWKDNMKRIEEECGVKSIAQGLKFFPRSKPRKEVRDNAKPNTIIEG